MFNTSLKSNLLISYSFFTFLLLTVGGTGYWYFLALSDIQDVQKNVFNVIINLSKLKEYETNFYSNESIDTNFYANHVSLNEKNLKITVDEIKSDIYDLHSKASFSATNSDKILLKMSTNLEKYSKEFSEITHLYYQKGFKNFGTEGEMRKHIHLIENQFPKFNKVVLLTTRRIEKDYIIRKDYEYVKKMNEHKKNVLKASGSDKKLNLLLKYYFSSFDLLVSFDTKIGFTNENGKKQLINNYFHNLSKASKELEDKVNYNLLVLKNEIKTKFITLIIVAVFLSLLMSFIFKKIIASNLSDLLEAIESNKISYFGRTNSFTIKSNITEFKVIQNKFIEMTDEIFKHTSDVEIKNKELTNINFLLKSTNEELRIQKSELQKVNTLKETFLSIISHDVKGPLLTLQKFLNLVIESPNLISPEKQMYHFKKLKDATDDQVVLLENLLNWSKTQNNDFKSVPTKFNVLQMSCDVIRLLEPAACAKKISIDNYVENEFVKADKNMTELILRNVISNAIKFTDIGGNITIQTFVLENDILSIEISDNGVGIQAETLELLNNNHFYNSTEGTLKERGSGFGLMFCKAFAEKMNGKMHIFSVLGEGTKVKIELSLVAYGLVNSN